MHNIHTLAHRLAVTSIRCGLIILTLLLEDKDIVSKLTEWSVPDLLQSVHKNMPDFAGKTDLLIQIGQAIPGFVLESVLNNPEDSRTCGHHPLYS